MPAPNPAPRTHLLQIEASSQVPRTPSSSVSAEEEEQEVSVGFLRLAAMGVEVPGCGAHPGHGSGVNSRRGRSRSRGRQERGAGLHLAQLARLSDAAHDRCPSNLRAYWCLCPDAHWATSPPPPPAEVFIGQLPWPRPHNPEDRREGGSKLKLTPESTAMLSGSCSFRCVVAPPGF